MSKSSKQEHLGKSDGVKRYRSMGEIKRDLFPNAAAEEAETSARSRGEVLMEDLFGPQHHSGLSNR